MPSTLILASANRSQTLPPPKSSIASVPSAFVAESLVGSSRCSASALIHCWSLAASVSARSELSSTIRLLARWNSPARTSIVAGSSTSAVADAPNQVYRVFHRAARDRTQRRGDIKVLSGRLLDEQHILR